NNPSITCTSASLNSSATVEVRSVSITNDISFPLSHVAITFHIDPQKLLDSISPNQKTTLTGWCCGNISTVRYANLTDIAYDCMSYIASNASEPNWFTQVTMLPILRTKGS